MKINKRSPKHWIYLSKSGTYILGSIIIRKALPKPRRPIIVLYGHKFNGNLKAFADYAIKQDELDVYYATLDPKYYESISSAHREIKILSLLKMKDVLKIARSSAIISDRQAHALIYYLHLTGIPFIDVWHGIPFKGFGPEDFKILKKYKEVWASSPALKDIYVKKWGMRPERVKVTGYARVDDLVNNNFSKKNLIKKYRITGSFKKIVLIAPTWHHDSRSTSFSILGVDPKEFLSNVNEIAKETGALVIFRAHINAKMKPEHDDLSMIRFMPHSEYPLGEDFLAMADVLVSDWSSIVFDYLPLHRPTVFMDGPPPFKGGFTAGKQHRFGEVVHDVDGLSKALRKYLKDPAAYDAKFGKKITEAEKFAFGSTLDGKSAERYYRRLKEILK